MGVLKGNLKVFCLSNITQPMVNQCFWVEKHWLNPNPWYIIRRAQKVPPAFWLEPRNPG
jgi:hypothetical protein